jgi:twitching motility protein PilT
MIYDIMNDKQRKDFEEFLETDFSFEIPKLSPASVSMPSTRTAAPAPYSGPFPRRS